MTLEVAQSAVSVYSFLVSVLSRLEIVLSGYGIRERLCLCISSDITEQFSLPSDGITKQNSQRSYQLKSVAFHFFCSSFSLSFRLSFFLFPFLFFLFFLSRGK